MTIYSSGGWLILSGGTSAARLTPANIISDATAFSSGSTYAVGSVVKYNAGGGLGTALYYCTTAVSAAGAWNATNWRAVAWITGTRTIFINNILSIEAYYDDSLWATEYASGCRFHCGTSCNWLSGSKVSDASGNKSIGRTAKIILQDTTLAWNFWSGNQISAGALLTWYGLTIQFYGAGFLKLMDWSATVHTMEDVVLDSYDGVYRWAMLAMNTTAASKITLYGITLGQNGNLPQLVWNFPSSAGDLVWSFPDAYSDQSVRIDGLKPVFDGAGQKLSLHRHAQTYSATYATKNPQYDWKGRDNYLLGTAGEITTRIIEHDVSLRISDAITGAEVNSVVRVVSGSTQKAAGTATSGTFSATAETYRKSIVSGGATTETDHTSLAYLIRKRDYREATLASAYTDLKAGALTKSTGIYPDTYYTADQSELAGISSDSTTKVITISAALTLDQIYDWLKWWLEQNMAVANMLAPSGKALGLLSGWTFSVSLYGAINAGTKLTSFSTTAAVTVATGGAITVPYVDSSGVQASITNIDPYGFGTTWVLGFITTANYNGRTPNTAPATWTGWEQSSGTGNSARITLAQSTEYQIFLRIPGYFAPIGPIATIDTATQTSVSLPVIVDTDLTGSNLWPQTAAHTAQASKFTYNVSAQLVEYDNTTGATDYVTFLAAYRALELIAKAPSMAYQLIQPVYINGSRDGFTLPRTNPLVARMSSASTAGAIMQADISYADNQAKAFDRFRANGAHAHLLVPQMSASLTSSTIDAVRSGLALEASVQSRPTLAQIEESAVLAKHADVTAVGTAVASIPTNPVLVTDTRLDKLDATVSSRLASSAYAAPTTPPTVAQIRQEMDANSTKLANLDASVSSRLSSSEYTSPDNSKIGQIKTKVDTLQNADLSGVATSTQIQALPKLADMESSWKLTNGGLYDIGTYYYWERPEGDGTRYEAFVPFNSVISSADGISAHIDVHSGWNGSVDRLTAVIHEQPYGVLFSAAYIGSADISQYSAPILTILKNGVPVAKGTYLPGGPTLRDIEASNWLVNKSDVSAISTAVAAIPTNPVLATDARLDMLDATVSSRFALSAYTEPDNAGIAAIKSKTDNLPAQPAAVGSAMVLTSAYDVAKTAASQASVTALGSPLQAADYVAPDNSKIGQIKIEVDAIASDLSDLQGLV